MPHQLPLTSNSPKTVQKRTAVIFWIAILTCIVLSLPGPAVGWDTTPNLKVDGAGVTMYDETQRQRLHARPRQLRDDAPTRLYYFDPQLQESVPLTVTRDSIYVMDSGGKIYIHTNPIHNIIHHSSLLGGAPVAAAGHIEALNGIVTYIDNNSGHYRPDQKFLEQVTQQLDNDGILSRGATIFNSSPFRIEGPAATRIRGRVRWDPTPKNTWAAAPGETVIMYYRRNFLDPESAHYSIKYTTGKQYIEKDTVPGTFGSGEQLVENEFRIREDADDGGVITIVFQPDLARLSHPRITYGHGSIDQDHTFHIKIDKSLAPLKLSFDKEEVTVSTSRNVAGRVLLKRSGGEIDWELRSTLTSSVQGIASVTPEVTFPRGEDSIPVYIRASGHETGTFSAGVSVITAAATDAGGETVQAQLNARALLLQFEPGTITMSTDQVDPESVTLNRRGGNLEDTLQVQLESSNDNIAYPENQSIEFPAGERSIQVKVMASGQTPEGGASGGTAITARAFDQKGVEIAAATMNVRVPLRIWFDPEKAWPSTSQVHPARVTLYREGGPTGSLKVRLRTSEDQVAFPVSSDLEFREGQNSISVDIRASGHVTDHFTAGEATITATAADEDGQEVEADLTAYVLLLRFEPERAELSTANVAPERVSLTREGGEPGMLQVQLETSHDNIAYPISPNAEFRSGEGTVAVDIRAAGRVTGNVISGDATITARAFDYNRREIARAGMTAHVPLQLWFEPGMIELSPGGSRTVSLRRTGGWQSPLQVTLDYDPADGSRAYAADTLPVFNNKGALTVPVEVTAGSGTGDATLTARATDENGVEHSGVLNIQVRDSRVRFVPEHKLMDEGAEETVNMLYEANAPGTVTVDLLSSAPDYVAVVDTPVTFSGEPMKSVRLKALREGNSTITATARDEHNQIVSEADVSIKVLNLNALLGPPPDDDGDKTPKLADRDMPQLPPSPMSRYGEEDYADLYMDTAYDKAADVLRLPGGTAALPVEGYALLPSDEVFKAIDETRDFAGALNDRIVTEGFDILGRETLTGEEVQQKINELRMLRDDIKKQIIGEYKKRERQVIESAFRAFVSQAVQDYPEMKDRLSSAQAFYQRITSKKAEFDQLTREAGELIDPFLSELIKAKAYVNAAVAFYQVGPREFLKIMFVKVAQEKCYFLFRYVDDTLVAYGASAGGPVGALCGYGVSQGLAYGVCNVMLNALVEYATAVTTYSSDPEVDRYVKIFYTGEAPGAEYDYNFFSRFGWSRDQVLEKTGNPERLNKALDRHVTYLWKNYPDLRRYLDVKGDIAAVDWDDNTGKAIWKIIFELANRDMTEAIKKELDTMDVTRPPTDIERFFSPPSRNDSESWMSGGGAGPDKPMIVAEYPRLQNGESIPKEVKTGDVLNAETRFMVLGIAGRDENISIQWDLRRSDAGWLGDSSIQRKSEDMLVQFPMIKVKDINEQIKIDKNTFDITINEEDFKPGESYTLKVVLTSGAYVKEFEIPFRVVVQNSVNAHVTVVDASDTPAMGWVDIFVNDAVPPASSSAAPVTEHSALLMLEDRQTVSASARLEAPPENIEARSSTVTFDGSNPEDISLTVQLPFFDTDNLEVKGTFVPREDVAPVPVFTGSTIWTNAAYNALVHSGDSFSFRNQKKWPLQDPLTATALVWTGDDDGRVFRPSGGSINWMPLPGKVYDAGDIEVVPHEVKVEPIPISVTAWNGRQLPEDRVTVMVEDQPASWNGSTFEGTWMFRKRGEEITIRASFDMPYGNPVTGEATYRISDDDLFKDSVEGNPVEIKLEVYDGPFSINVTNSVRVPKDNTAPAEVKLDSAEIEGYTPAMDRDTMAADSTEIVRISAPVRLGSEIMIRASAKEDDVEYKGVGRAIVPGDTFRSDMMIELRPKGEAADVSIQDMAVAGESGSSRPVSGQGMTGRATIVMGDVESPALSVGWQRMSDSGQNPVNTVITTVKNGAVPVEYVFDPLPKSRQVKYDWIEITVSDGFAPDPDAKERLEFEWQESDEFIDMTFTDEEGKPGAKFEIGDAVTVGSSWKIVDDSEAGEARHITYRAKGDPYFDGDGTVQPGRKWTHRAAPIDTGGMAKGRVEIQADLYNPKTDITAIGRGSFVLVEGKDEITHAQAGVAQGVNGRGRRFSTKETIDAGTTVHINVKFQASKNLDGMRTLGVSYRGDNVMSYAIDMRGGESAERSFAINTGKLEGKLHRFTVYLANENGLQDKRPLRVEVKESSAAGGSGGLQDVTCTGDTVSVMVWDHGAQDGDIITLTIGGRQLLSGFDLNGCGGAEPGCALMNQSFPAGSKIPVTIYAHNEGSASPNTAALKVEGGCTPELQHWGLKTGGSASIFLIRSTAPQQQGAQPGAPGQQAPAQQPIQSWP